MQIWIDPGPETPDPDVPPDLILVTHAHHDHIGQLAQLARLSPGCRIVMTPGTLELLTLNGAGQALAQRLREQAVVLPVDTPRDFGSVTVRFWPAGHLLGAVMIELCHGRDKVLITGDFALRDVGGLRPDAAPSGAYTLVMMEATMADWGSLPFAAPYYNRRPVLDAVNEAIATGARIVALPAQALGQAQEIYVALTLAQRAGAFPDWQVGLTGFSAAVSDLYHASLSRARGPWRRRPWACDSRPPDHSLVITSDQYQIPGAGIVHERALTHAGWGEHMALVLGVACRHLAFYHGSATSLRIVLDEMGFHTHNLPLEN
jgi:Cft2 family RNA processing exonuclease